VEGRAVDTPSRESEAIVRAGILYVGGRCGLIAFLGSGPVTPAAGEPGKLERSPAQCVKGGKAVPTAKTKAACTKGGGVWGKMDSMKIPPDPLGKSKARPPAGKMAPVGAR